jgi:hypothetical protein
MISLTDLPKKGQKKFQFSLVGKVSNCSKRRASGISSAVEQHRNVLLQQEEVRGKHLLP